MEHIHPKIVITLGVTADTGHVGKHVCIIDLSYFEVKHIEMMDKRGYDLYLQV